MTLQAMQLVKLAGFMLHTPGCGSLSGLGKKSSSFFFVSSGSQLMKFQANFQSYSSVFSNHLQTVSHSSTVTSSESPFPQFVIFMDTNIPPLL